MQHTRSSNATHKENTLCETSCFYGNYWLHKIFSIFKYFLANPPEKFFSLRHKMANGWDEHLLLPSYKVKNEWSFTSSRPTYVMVCKGTIILTSQQINIYVSVALKTVNSTSTTPMTCCHTTA